MINIPVRKSLIFLMKSLSFLLLFSKWSFFFRAFSSVFIAWFFTSCVREAMSWSWTQETQRSGCTGPQIQRNYRMFELVPVPSLRHPAAPRWLRSNRFWRARLDEGRLPRRSPFRCIRFLHTHDYPDRRGNQHHHTGCLGNCHLRCHCCDHHIPEGRNNALSLTWR